MQSQKVVVRTRQDAETVKTLLQTAWKTWAMNGQAFEVRVGKHQQRRSLSQNALMHMWFGEVATETGQSPEEVKAALKQMFLPMVTIKLKGVPILTPQSTSALSKEQGTEFLERINAWASEWGIHLTQPEPEWWADQREVCDVPTLGQQYGSALAGHLSE